MELFVLVNQSDVHFAGSSAQFVKNAQEAMCARGTRADDGDICPLHQIYTNPTTTGVQASTALSSLSIPWSMMGQIDVARQSLNGHEKLGLRAGAFRGD